jgi:flavin-dependent thymidylate synthase
MKVYLAGYNVDTNVLNEIEEQVGKRDDLTPEVLSASYARISRDSRPINEIRRSARKEVERSRKSNSTIIFKMGHHSVAEHAVFNLDILVVSRYGMEELEKFRLCSYTEKSQRYITLKNNYILPDEIKGTPHESLFISMVDEQNKAYITLFNALRKYVFTKHGDLASEKKNHDLLEGWAKEDARYITSLATESQVGMTINARNLELMLRRFASHPLMEIKNLGKAIYTQIVAVAPSIVIFHKENDLDRDTYPQLRNVSQTIISNHPVIPDVERKQDVQLVEWTENADDIIAASLLHTSSDLSYSQCLSLVKTLNRNEKEDIYKTSWQNLQLYDSLLREFEYIHLTFNIVLSSSCFGQLKRHRMSTLTSQQYSPQLGHTVPESIKKIGMDSFFREITNKTEEAYYTIRKDLPLAAPYILTNAHRKRALIRMNARELYHISRLREDSHAQWDIRNISLKMSKLAKKEMPNIFKCIGGKDRFNTIYLDIFRRNPKITEVKLPSIRNIT